MFKSDKDEELYYHEFKNLMYSSEYNCGVRGANRGNSTEGRDSWISFKTPPCMELSNDSTKCPPEAIEDFKVKFIPIEGHRFSFNVSWNETTYKPDFYELELRDVNPGRRENDSLDIYRYRIDKVS